MRITIDFLIRSKRLHFFLLFLFASFLVFNQFSFYTRFPFDESGSVIRTAIGQIEKVTALYLSEVIDAKNRILWFQLVRQIYERLPQLDPGLYNPVLGLFSSIMAVIGCAFLLKKGGAGWISALNWSLFGLLFFAFSYLSYGYHYKIAQGGTSTGVIAFGLMTLLIGICCPIDSKSKVKFYTWAIPLLVLFTVHPLNALFCIGLLGAGWIFSIFPVRALFQIGALGIILALITFHFYSVPLQPDQKEMLWNLIHLINGEGKVSGYFIPWKNSRVLIQEIGFWFGFQLLLYIGLKEKWFSRSSIQYFQGIFFCCLFLGLIHYLIYWLKLPQYLATDPSRTFALLRPVGLILLLQGIRISILSKSPRAILQFFTFFSFPFLKVTLFPFFVLLFSRFSRRIFSFGLLFALFISVLHLNLHYPVTALDWGRLWFFLGLFAFVISHFIPKRFSMKIWTIDLNKLFYGTALLLSIISFAHLKLFPLVVQNTNRIRELRSLDNDFMELVAFLDKNVAKNSIIFTPIEKLLLGSEIRGAFAGFHTAGYGIYFGKLDKLNKELKIIWNIDLTNSNAIALLNSAWANKGGYSRYLEDHFSKISTNSIRTILRAYNDFKAIILPKDFRLINQEEMIKNGTIKQEFINNSFIVYSLEKRGFNNSSNINFSGDLR